LAVATGFAHPPCSSAGHFFLDLYPREGKYGHQCVLPIRPSCNLHGEYITPAVAMIANMPRPTPENPGLLHHSQVWANAERLPLGHVPVMV
jgi:Zn-dependent oligopeptidase